MRIEDKRSSPEALPDNNQTEKLFKRFTETGLISDYLLFSKERANALQRSSAKGDSEK